MNAVRAWRRGLVWLLALMFLPAWDVAPARAQGTLSALETDVDHIARRARPSVVTVLALRNELIKVRTKSRRRTRTRVGTGLALAENEILTTASVILGAEQLLVQSANGLQVRAELVGMDPISNLALIRVPTLRLPPLRTATRRSEIGDWVISLGTSYGAQPTQSVGNVAYRFQEPRQSLLQLSNIVYPGNSGAAALNAKGELIGIVQGELGAPDAVAREAGEERRPRGPGFVLPIESVRPVYQALRREGRVRHGFLGVTTRSASVESEGGSRIPIGALVEGVVSGSPAEQVGVRRGDLIVAFERERVEYPEQLARWVAASHPGTAVDLVWVRDDIQREGRPTLRESPQAVPQWVATTPAAPGGAPLSAERITELEREIRRLSEQLDRLRTEPRSGRP
ncbi:MAG TPA: S1C family serine protease [Candidatus Limnocylindria bacterium]|nr:S1C family serine protease [Candidatus Limnocylindria bacterium]